MDEPLIYHLTHADGQWTVSRETHDEPLGDFSNREEALHFARIECGKIGLARLLIHADDGTVATEHFSGQEANLPGA